MYWLVGIGGAAGALSRFLLTNLVHGRMGTAFPYGTFLVNLLGSFIIGFLYFWLINRYNADAELRGLLIVGFLGAFTTFSAFSIETLILLEQGAWIRGTGYVVASVLGCVIAAGAGMLLARWV